MNVDVVIFEGVDELDVFGPFHVLGSAGRAGADIRVRLVALDEPTERRTSRGAQIRAGGLLGPRPGSGVDLLVIPGGGWNDRARSGAWAEAERGNLPEAIARWHRDGATIASVCTGAGIVAASGILAGREASTHHHARDDLRARGVEIVDARVVDDGEILSAGGITAGLDLALHMVEREWGPELAGRIAEQMEYERRGPLHRGRNARC